MTKARKFQPNWESVKTHKLPIWYDDIKLGIFIHWGPYSVPAFAPPNCELGGIPQDEGWYCNNPYAEWYLNSIRTKKGPTYEHHVKTYGENFDYQNFSYMWRAENWDPDEWADLFRKSGAGYVVLTTKHHDGFCLWPSNYTNYNSGARGPKRDLMGELTEAVRKKGLKMGAYYSGIIDWTFTKEPILDTENSNELIELAPITNVYADYAYNQVIELIDRYKPSIIWNDIGWPLKGEEDLKYLFAHYYNKVENGVVNDRWNNTWCDFTCKEYKLGEISLDKKWEMCRGIGYSFGYNAKEGEEFLLSGQKLVNLLVSSVSHNGNLLINVGPKADGTIPKEQAERLLALGSWLSKNGEAIYGTKPFARQNEKDANGIEIFFTRKGADLFIILDNIKTGTNEVIIEDIINASNRACILDGGIYGIFEDTGNGLKIIIEGSYDEQFAVAIKISGYIE